MKNVSLPLAQPEPLPGTYEPVIQFEIVADGGFSLCEHILR